jgi:hypothetical protein
MFFHPPFIHPSFLTDILLFFGEGGVYRMKELRIGAEMLNHLKSEVLRIGRDLNNLLYAVLTHDPGPLQEQKVFQAVGLPLYP